MIEVLVRDRCPAAVPRAEAMVSVLREMPGPRLVEAQAWYEEACWARAALEQGVSDLPNMPAVVAARMSAPLVADEPAGLHGLRVARDCAPVRMVYLLYIAAKLRMGDHPKPLPKTAARVERAKVAEWNIAVSRCGAMLYGLGACEAYMEAAVRPPPWR
ncbi:MAG: hypothetical protein EBT79_09170 [Actinobacteria bacterium]|nr:hypothetical protein [Actinomycetota bacterium]